MAAWNAGANCRQGPHHTALKSSTFIGLFCGWCEAAVVGEHGHGFWLWRRWGCRFPRRRFPLDYVFVFVLPVQPVRSRCFRVACAHKGDRCGGDCDFFSFMSFVLLILLRNARPYHYTERAVFIVNKRLRLAVVSSKSCVCFGASRLRRLAWKRAFSLSLRSNSTIFAGGYRLRPRIRGNAWRRRSLSPYSPYGVRG